ncbi:MAG: hypothetical protein C0600_09745 [Ignavibacteria bacterium]|nr:MAG: hypothetical protein C0600_09745 [Ignavibacteria bacterium]
MRLPSIEQITRDAGQALRRFPFVLAVAAIGTLAALVLAENQSDFDNPWAFRVLFAAILGVPLLIGLKLFLEKRRSAALTAMMLQSTAIAALVVYAFTLPSQIPAAPAFHIARMFMLAVALHLFVAVAPWLGRGQANGFWQFNKALLLRFITAALFTLVLYGGLALALAAVENLFELTIKGERYLQLWILLAGMLNTWFFLAGVPEDLDALDDMSEYPKALKVFTQYVLFPLVLVYLVILVAYTGKIMVTWTWPYGWTARLILGFSVAGMLALLLLHPIREDEGNRWVRLVTRWFYVVLAPLVVVYFLAVFRRISEYGITEGRYIAIATGVWLAAMVLYFLFSRGKSIKAIPLTMAVLTALISFGPWGAFSVSEQSQVARMQTILEENQVLRDGKIIAPEDSLAFPAAKEVSAVLDYLHEMHGYEAIEAWFGESLKADAPEARSEWKDPSEVTAMLGAEFVPVFRLSSADAISLEAAYDDVLVVTGYDRILPSRYFDENGEKELIFDEGSYEFSSAFDSLTLRVSHADSLSDTVVVALKPFVDSLRARYHNSSSRDIPIESMSVSAEGIYTRVKVYFWLLRLQRQEEDVRVTRVRVQVLWGKETVPAFPSSPTP